MRVNLIMSLSADPAVQYLDKIRQMAYASTPNPVRKVFEQLGDAEDYDLVIFGTRHLSSQAEVVGFCIEDPMSGPQATYPDKLRVTKITPSQVFAQTPYQVLLRIPLERL